MPGVPWHTQILADQLTLFQPRGTDYAHLITTGTPGFSDLPAALSQKVVDFNFIKRYLLSFSRYVPSKVCIHIKFTCYLEASMVDVEPSDLINLDHF